MATQGVKGATRFRVRRIARDYGGCIVVTVPNLPESEAFCDRVERFFAESAELPLFPGDMVAQGERDIAAVIDAARDWPLSFRERQVRLGATIAYQAPRRSPVEGETFKSGAGIELRGVSYFIANAQEPRAFTETELGLSILHEEQTHATEVELQMGDAALTTIKKGLARFSPVTQDVLALLIANAFNNEPDSRGAFVVDVDDILNARGLEKKKTGKYEGSHHVEARVSVVQAVKDLSTLFVATDPIRESRRNRRLKDWVSVLQIERLSTLDDAGVDRMAPMESIDPKKVVAIQYRLGPWFEGLKAFQHAAPRSVLALDGQREGTAKKLGHYFVQRALDVDREGRIVRQLRTVFRETATKMDANNPQRMRDRFENALNKLVQIRALSEWGYTVPNPDAHLPAYKWVEPWLNLYVWVRLPS